jgi:hypothetical protein
MEIVKINGCWKFFRCSGNPIMTLAMKRKGKWEEEKKDCKHICNFPRTPHSNLEVPRLKFAACSTLLQFLPRHHHFCSSPFWSSIIFTISK